MGADMKIALVSGSTSGLGAEIAQELARSGHAVMVTGRNADRASLVVEAIESAGGTASLWIGDLAEAENCQMLIDATVKRFGGIDVLVNNAGGSFPGTAEDTSNERWLNTLAINASAVFYLSRAVVPLMRSSGGGVIVNIASTWALVGGKGGVAYCASKGAVLQMTKAMALDHACDNIRINAVCPGECETPLLRRQSVELGLDPDGVLAELAEKIPLRRLATGSDVAKLVAFLTSDGANYMTGSAILVDGGALAA